MLLSCMSQGAVVPAALVPVPGETVMSGEILIAYVETYLRKWSRVSRPEPMSIHQAV